ncbi:hypothetical protein LRS73_16600 [Methylobacterium currus]|uniref:hypothetical protein n=1 Tax=Methylobacterium currus TaxID=2051553 RepID=UPI001E5B414F|nr:hypothetical protein [Methylobacterium currus]UHC14196.1 hypothetical protein LRS73_16600 [Methylobacterium currus]
MAITFDERWFLGPDGRSRMRHVYSAGDLIGRVWRWHEDEPGEMIHEWFTAERMNGASYEPIAGEHATFEEALEHIVTYSVAQ